MEPFKGAGKEENSFATMAKMKSPKSYNHKSSNGTRTTSNIPASIELKKPLVNTSGGQK
jgi:hypothetical protein